MILQVSKTLSLPLDVTAMASAIFGIRNSGKTNTASVLVEEALKASQRCAILDPLDVWWGLKSSADGNSAGFDVVIFGGPHQDLPLLFDQGKVLARLVVENPITAVFSLRHLRKHQQVRFGAEFLEELYYLKGEPKYRERLFLAIDECSTFVPQSFTRGGGAGDGEKDYTARCVGAVEDTIRRGRNAGFGVCLIDQRPASVNKNALSQCELLVLHRLVAPQDRDALKEYSRAQDDAEKSNELFSTLALLGQTPETKGEAWIWSPFLGIFERAQIRKRETFDSSKTPEHGEAAAVPTELARVDLDAIRSMLGDAIADAEANDPKTLKKRIADLEAKLAKGIPSEDVLLSAIAEATEVLRSQLADQAEILEEGAGIAERLMLLFGQHARVGKDPLDLLGKTPNNMPGFSKEPEPPQKPVGESPTREIPATSGEITKLQKTILDAIATFAAIKNPNPLLGHVGVLIGKWHNAGPIRGAFNKLVEAGLIVLDSKALRVQLTDAGRVLARAMPTPRLSDIHGMWLRKGDNAREMLRELIERHPQTVSIEQLGQRVGKNMNAGPIRGALNSLVDMGLATLDGTTVAATSLLFPEGLK